MRDLPPKLQGSEIGEDIQQLTSNLHTTSTHTHTQSCTYHRNNNRNGTQIYFFGRTWRMLGSYFFNVKTGTERKNTVTFTLLFLGKLYLRITK